MRLIRRAFPGFRWNHYALSLAMLAVIVFVLAVLQYRWIDQVSEAQEARATSRVREKLRLVTDAFDAEITRAVLAFTNPSALGAPVPDKLEQAWTTWKHEAPWPGIVSGVAYLESDDDGWKLHSWGAAGALDPRSLLPADDLVPERTGGAVLHVQVQGRALFVNGQPCMVEDRGLGIEEDEARTVFEPFFRGSSARRSRHAGSGLGLAIVKSAVDAYGGGIELEPAIPHGCRFRLFFPIVHDVDTVHSTGSEEPPHGVASHTLDRR
jgi:Histidine kinase-, DNA gyrase B-, and HSP90-like ATPase